VRPDTFRWGRYNVILVPRVPKLWNTAT
jgi:hypothetical protein